jgi:hypothetical protein
MMKRMKVVFLLLSLALQSAAGESRIEFRDFSQKGAEYKSLENLRFADADVTYSGDESINILGEQYSASKYSMSATVRVQTVCAIGTVNTEVYQRVTASFEIFVVEDKDKSIHDAFVKTIYDLWSRKELYSGESFFDFSAKGSHYVLTSMPDLVNFYFFWVNGRMVKIVFKGFREKQQQGWGVMDSFTADNLRIRVADAEFKAYQFPLSPQKKFLKLYREGFFSSRRTAEQRHSPDAL